MRRALAALCLAALVAGVAEARPKPKPAAKRKCEIVVFQRQGKTVRRCRKVPRKLVAPVRLPNVPAPAGPAPAAPPPAAPQPQPQAPAPGGPSTTPTTPDEPPPRDPWFLTLYARDVGNGDFRLLPAPGDIPAGTLYLSLKNDDLTEHDLWLEPAGGEPVLIFPPYAGPDLQRTRLELTPGTYTFLCAMPGHGAMRQRFAVTP